MKLYFLKRKISAISLRYQKKQIDHQQNNKQLLDAWPSINLHFCKQKDRYKWEIGNQNDQSPVDSIPQDIKNSISITSGFLRIFLLFLKIFFVAASKIYNFFLFFVFYCKNPLAGLRI